MFYSLEDAISCETLFNFIDIKLAKKRVIINGEKMY